MNKSGSSHKKGQMRIGSRLKIPVAHVFGLTGGIAAGKSTAARLFAEEGIFSIDADQIARDLSKKGGRAHEAIVTRFGTADTTQLREIVFSDPRARKDLEAILHPLIRLESQSLIQNYIDRLGLSDHNVPVIYEAALLVETGYYKQLAGLIVVTAKEELRKQRLQNDRGLSAEMAEKMIRSQIDDESRCAPAHFVLSNSDSLDKLRLQVQAIVPQLKDWKKA